MKVLIGAAGTTEPLPLQREPTFTEHERQYGVWDGVTGTQTGSRVAVSGSVCTFWCAVAVGGLLQGRPLEAVRARNAWNDLLLWMDVAHPLSEIVRDYREMPQHNRTEYRGGHSFGNLYSFEGGDNACVH